MQTTTNTKPVSPAQTGYLNDLLAKITNPAVQEALRADLRTLYAARLLDTREASRQIDRVKAILVAQGVAQAAAPAPVAAPAVAPQRLPYPVVAQGRYAVEVDGVLRFYNVTKNDAGTRTFVKRYVSDTLVKVNSGEAVRALRAIEADPAQAQQTYARETTRCYTCGRRLTDPESMERGQGPDCAGR